MPRGQSRRRRRRHARKGVSDEYLGQLLLRAPGIHIPRTFWSPSAHAEEALAGIRAPNLSVAIAIPTAQTPTPTQGYSRTDAMRLGILILPDESNDDIRAYVTTQASLTWQEPEQISGTNSLAIWKYNDRHFWIFGTNSTASCHPRVAYTIRMPQFLATIAEKSSSGATPVQIFLECPYQYNDDTGESRLGEFTADMVERGLVSVQDVVNARFKDCLERGGSCYQDYASGGPRTHTAARFHCTDMDSPTILATRVLDKLDKLEIRGVVVQQFFTQLGSADKLRKYFYAYAFSPNFIADMGGEASAMISRSQLVGDGTVVYAQFATLTQDAQAVLKSMFDEDWDTGIIPNTSAYNDNAAFKGNATLQDVEIIKAVLWKANDLMSMIFTVASMLSMSSIQSTAAVVYGNDRHTDFYNAFFDKIHANVDDGSSAHVFEVTSTTQCLNVLRVTSAMWSTLGLGHT